jgi:H+/Cl- antiporter ClcA
MAPTGQPDTSGPQKSLDVGAVIRQPDYIRLLVFAALVGVVVSLASWCFLEIVHDVQQWVFKDLPPSLGFETVPTWWPLPVLAIAGVIITFAVVRLPGRGGHEPWKGLSGGGATQPVDLPGVMLAALAGLCLGMVVGPEAPLIALGTGLAIFAVKRAKADAPDQLVAVLAAAGSFAAISSIFGSPVIGAVILIEAAGLGGPTLPLVLLPGLLAAGIGSLVFIGMGSWTGLSSAAFAITPLSLPSYAQPTLGSFGWTIVLSIAAAIVTFLIVELGRHVAGWVERRPFVIGPIAGILVAVAAIVFHQITQQPADLVLFSGQDAMDPIVQQAGTLSMATLAYLILFKGLAWGISLGGARGGPTFPALFLGIAGGLLAGHLPGFAETPGVAVLLGAMCVSMLRLPLSSVVLALVVSQAGLAAAPLIIVGVVIAYIATDRLHAFRGGDRVAAAGNAAAEAGPAG